MFLSFLFLFFFLIVCAGALFFFFGFFVPALKIRYDGFEELLYSEEFKNKDLERQSEQEELLSKNSEGVNQFAVVNQDVFNLPKEKVFSYKGEKSCLLFGTIYSSEYKIQDRLQPTCFGFGDCQKVCPQEAIVIKKGKVEVTSMCDGCGKCIDACPQKLISLSAKRPELTNKYFKLWNFCYKLFPKKTEKMQDK